MTRLRDIQVEATANETFETGVFEKIAYHAGLPQLAASLLQCSRTASAEYLKIVFALLQYICDGYIGKLLPLPFCFASLVNAK